MESDITCRVCKESKPVECFSRNCRRLSGRAGECKSCASVYKRTYRADNPAKIAAGKRRHYEANREKVAADSRAYYKKNRTAMRAASRAYVIGRRKTDPEFRLRCSLRERMNRALDRNQKSGSPVRDLGCSVEDFKAHLEAQFEPGMTWNNWGCKPGQWSIDHIMPLAAFDLADRQHFLLAAHYLNMRPMWHVDNMRRRRRAPFGYQVSADGLQVGGFLCSVY